jgi:hypothetical protein
MAKKGEVKKSSDSRQIPKDAMNQERLNRVLQAGVQRGLEELAENNFIFRNASEVIQSNYISKPAVQELGAYAAQVYLKSPVKPTPDQLVGIIADEVKKGKILTEQGKAFLFNEKVRQDAESVGLFNYLRRNRARKVIDQDDEVSKAIGSFEVIKEMMEHGDYAKRMPELAKNVTQLYDAKFFNAAANVLYAGKLLDDNRYYALKNSIHKQVKDISRDTTSRIEQLAQGNYRVAASVLAVLGLGSVLFNNSITGNVIGIGNPDLFGLIGGAFLFLAGVLLLGKAKK